MWLGEAAAVLLADDLNALGVDAIRREERREAFEKLQVPRASSLTDATVIRIGELVGASQVVVGTLQLDGDTLVVRARAFALEAGRVVSDVTERGEVSDLFAMFERVAERIKSPASAAGNNAARAHPSMAAFENYIKGLLAETPSTALNYLNAALKAEPSFDRARLAMWDVYAEQGEHERALEAVIAGARHLGGLATRAFSRRALAVEPPEGRRGLRDVQCPRRRRSLCRSLEQRRRCPGQTWTNATVWIADVLLQQGRGNQPDRARLFLQPRIRLLGRAQHFGSDAIGCVRR